jgi:hypothetical protein
MGNSLIDEYIQKSSLMNLLLSRVPGNMSPKQEHQNEKEIF